jgi:hypothetical protein
MTAHDEPPLLTTPEPEDLAAWVEHRLHDCAAVGGGARLYGLEVLDAHGFAVPDGPAGRLTFVDEGADATALVLGAACADAVRRFDVVALVVTRWEPALVPLPRPGGRPVRRRARVVTVVGDAGTASARRFDHVPDRVEVWPGLAGAGIAGVQLAAMWAGRGA